MVEGDNTLSEEKKWVRLDEAIEINGQKLSDCLESLEYEIEAFPDITSLKLTGKCIISFKARLTFHALILHMKDLTVLSSVISQAGASDESEALIELDSRFV